MPITLKDVAELAGVSRSAVSRTYTDGASVSDRTRAKVEKAARELGYHPNVLASSLTTGRTKLIGLVSNNFANPYFLEVFDRFTRRLQQAGLRPLLVNLSAEEDTAKTLQMLRQYSVDGVIVASSTLPPRFAAAFQEAGLPMVHAFGWSQASARSHLVSIDNVESGRLAAQTLAARGYRRIAFLGGPNAALTTQDRLRGVREVVAEQPELCLSVSFASGYAFQSGQTEMQRVIAAGDLAEAYFCGDDVIALGAISAARDAGLRVPDDVGFLGLNDMEIAGWNDVALTTIRQPIGRIVETAVDLIQTSIRNPNHEAETRLFSCQVVERDTLRAIR